MVAHLHFQNMGRFQVGWEKISCFDLPLFQISLSEQGKLFPLRLKKVNQLCSEHKIHRVIAPSDFSHWLKLPHLRPYDPLPSLQSLGGDCLLHLLKKAHISPYEATVVLQAPSVTPILESVAFQLAPQVKALVIDTLEGQDHLQKKLYQQFGLAPCCYQSEVTATLLFSPPTATLPSYDCSPNGEKILPPPSYFGKIFLPLYPWDSPIFQCISIKKENFPCEIPYLPLIALLLETQKISKKDLEFY